MNRNPRRRVRTVLELARTGEVTTADVMRALSTNRHDAARLMAEMRADGLLEPIARIEHGRLANRITDAGEAELGNARFTRADFGPLLRAWA